MKAVDIADSNDLETLREVTLWMIEDHLPTYEDREFADAKKAEIEDEGGVAFDVLYARLGQTGCVGLDRDYLGSMLLRLKEGVDAVTNVREQIEIVDAIANALMHDTSRKSLDRHPTIPPRNVLDGEFGPEMQHEFLRGALYGVSLMYEASLIERLVSVNPE